MTKKQLKVEEMNASEYRVFLQQQAYELRQTAVKASGDPQATIEGASDAAKAKATHVMDAPLVAKSDERRVTPESVGNVEGDAVPKSAQAESTADLNPPKVKETAVSDDKAKQ